MLLKSRQKITSYLGTFIIIIINNIIIIVFFAMQFTEQRCIFFLRAGLIFLFLSVLCHVAAEWEMNIFTL